MDAYLRPLVSYCLYTTIIRKKKKDFGEIEKIEKLQSKERVHLCVCVCVEYISVSLCVVMYVILSMCVCMMADLRSSHEYMCSDV